MSFVGDLFGGSRGYNYRAKSAPIIEPATLQQAQQAYEQAQQGITQQQAFVNALQQQGGLANQAAVFQQLQDVAAGRGPNPALAALQQATGQNVANQAALMAGQRGAGRNVGLMARQAGMQGAGLQQQAAGQGAALQAQQQMNALGQLGGLANQQVAQQQQGLSTLGQMGQQEQANILNAIQNINASRVGMQSNVNAVQGGLESARGAASSNLLGMGAAAAAMAMLNKGGQVPEKQHFANGGMPESFVGNFLTNPNMVREAPLTVAQAMQFAQPDKYKIERSPETNTSSTLESPEVMQGARDIQRGAQSLGESPVMDSIRSNPSDIMSTVPKLFAAHGAYVPDSSILNALNQSDNSKEVNLDYTTLNDGGAVFRNGMYAQGGMAPSSLMVQGGHVPGKAVVQGDSPKNDIVDAKLSPGEIVIPRSIVNHPNAPELAAKFVKETLAKNKFKSKKKYNGSDGIGGVGDDESDDDAQEPEVKTLQDPENAAPVQSNVPVDINYVPSDTSYDTSVESLTPKLPGSSSVKSTSSDLSSIGEVPGLVDTLEKGYKDYIEDYRKLGQLQQAQATKEAEIYGQNIIDLQRQKRQDEEDRKKIDAERVSLRNDIQNFKIDPHRLAANATTWDKVRTSIALILGGIGAGLSHTENPVIKHLNDLIDRDIDAQKAELGKKQTLLSANLQAGRDLRDSQAAARAFMLDEVNARVKAAAGNNPIMLARAKVFSDQLQNEINRIILPLRAKETQKKEMENRLLQSTNPTAALTAPKAAQFAGQAPDPIEFSKTLNLQGQDKKELQEAITRAKQITKNQAEMLRLFDKNAIESRFITGLTKGEFHPIHALGKATTSEEELSARENILARDLLGKYNEQAKKDIANLRGVRFESDEDVQNKRNAYKALINEKYQEAVDKAKSLGLDLTRFPQTNPVLQQVSKFPDGFRTFQLALQHPNDPDSQAFFKKIGFSNDDPYIQSFLKRVPRK